MSAETSNLAVGVVLRADGSGLVGQANLSADAIDKLAASTRGAAGAAKELTSATKAYGSIYTSNWWQDEASRIDEATRATKANSKAANDNARSLGAQRAAYQQMGYQLQDVFVQAQMGTSAFVILGQQGGQLAQAFALLGHSADGAKGKFAAFTSFMAGPYGIAATVALTAAAALASALMKNADAAESAKVGSSGLADAQSVLGQMFDLASGKIKKQNELLLLNARLTQLNLQSEAATDRARSEKTFSSTGDLSLDVGVRVGAAQGVLGPLAGLLQPGFGTAQQNLKQLQQLDAARQIAMKFTGDARAQMLDAILRNTEKVDFAGLNISRDEYRQAIIDSASADAKEAIAEEMKKTLDSGELSDVFRQEKSGRKKKDTSAKDAAKAAREAERLADFGDRAAESIARINDQFNAAPKEVDRARQATAQLDAIIKDINERLTGSNKLTKEQKERFEGLKGAATDLKPLIQESLLRPIRDLLTDQEQQIALGEAQLSGRESEAEALQLTYQLMAMMGVESKEQLATELAKRGVTGDQVQQLYDNLDVMRLQTREMEAQRAEQQAYLSALDAVQDNIRQTLADLRTRGPKAIGDMFRDLLTTADNLFADVVSEQLFGDLFRDLKDEVTGADKVSRAGEKMAGAVDDATTSIERLASATQAAADKITGTVTSTSGAAAGVPSSPAEVGEATIEVTAKRLKDTFKEGYEGVFDDFKTGIKSVFTDVFGDKGLFPESLSKSLGAGLANAQIGAMVGSGVAGALGLGGSSTGGALGGALGGAVGSELLGNALGSFAGPLGSIVGGVFGSVLGGLFKKAKYGTASLTGNNDEDVSVRGNKSSYRDNASTAAGSVQDGLDRIAEMFGAAVGDYSLSIGQYKDNWRVRDDAFSGKLNFSGSSAVGLHDFGKDGAAEAIAYAISNAVADGAIEGVSDKIAKALKSSPDIEEALQEAVKVRDLEILVGGVVAEMEDSFRQFETQAKERLRIATDYGFDVVEIEKRNAEDRAALVDEILTQRVGSLQSLLDDMAYGDLFEGSAADQRQALLAEIAKAQQSALAGEDGAADTLANLNRRLVELSRDAFGTAGSEYASDRAGAISSAQAVIDTENARIKTAEEAAAATNTKLDEANDLATEANGLSAEANRWLAQMAATMKSWGGASGGLDLSSVARGAI